MAGLGASSQVSFDLAQRSVRELNRFLHRDAVPIGARKVCVINPDGAHSVAVGVNAALEIDIDGHVGYYAGGMNQHAAITVRGNAGPGVAEGMCSGRVRVTGFASVAAGAAAHGGLLIIDGDASLRCGISMKGIDIVVRGSVGDYSAFMAQAGHLVVCGDAGDALGDSLYEADIYVRGSVKSLGADAQVVAMSAEDERVVAQLLAEAGYDYDPHEFTHIATQRSLYHWNADANQEY